jgi:DNA-binding phage protein
MIDAGPSYQAAEGLSAAELSTYLVACGWSARPSRVDGISIFSNDIRGASQAVEFILPVKPGFDDEQRRIADALRSKIGRSSSAQSTSRIEARPWATTEVGRIEMSTRTRRSDPKFVLAYDRGMLRSAFVSLFLECHCRAKEERSFTLQGLAKTLGKNKAEVSRWFKSEPNWTISTIAHIAHALNLELQIRAVDKAVSPNPKPCSHDESSRDAWTQHSASHSRNSGWD